MIKIKKIKCVILNYVCTECVKQVHVISKITCSNVLIFLNNLFT